MEGLDGNTTQIKLVSEVAVAVAFVAKGSAKIAVVLSNGKRAFPVLDDGRV